MTTAPVFLPLTELVDRIAALSAQRKTGNLVLISDDNRMAQMHMLQGLIVFLMCRGRRGQDALPLMRTISSARMSLDSNAEIRTDGGAFSTASVLAYLKGATEQLPEPSAAVDAVVQAAPGVAQAPAAPAAKAVAKGVSPDARHMLQAVMVRYIGPMAEIVCGEHFDTIQDLRALITALAAEIPNKDQRGAFLAEVAKSLGIAPF